MASYAPLFAHVDGWQWTPDLIWFDNLRSYATPNYYVQQLFSLNKGTDVVPLTKDGEMVSGQDGAFATASIDKNTKELIVKLVNSTDKPQLIKVDISSKAGYQKTAWVTTLGNYKKDAVNSLDAPKAVFPVKSTLAVNARSAVINVEPFTFKIVRLKSL
jgi:alpha-N-arabinofuranosidase